MSKRSDIRTAIITELLDAGNSTTIVSAKSYKENAGDVYAMVHTDRSEKIEPEGSQYFWEQFVIIISIYGRTLVDVETAADVIQVLFYKTTPLANLQDQGVTNMQWTGIDPNPDHQTGIHRLDVSYTCEYRNTYTL